MHGIPPNIPNSNTQPKLSILNSHAEHRVTNSCPLPIAALLQSHPIDMRPKVSYHCALLDELPRVFPLLGSLPYPLHPKSRDDNEILDLGASLRYVHSLTSYFICIHAVLPDGHSLFLSRDGVRIHARRTPTKSHRCHELNQTRSVLNYHSGIVSPLPPSFTIMLRPSRMTCSTAI